MKEKIEKLTYTRNEAVVALQVSMPVLDFYLKREENPIPSIRLTSQECRGKVLIPIDGLIRWINEEAARQAAARRSGDNSVES